MQLPLFKPPTEWVMPDGYPDLSSYEEIAIDLETKDPNLTVITFSIMLSMMLGGCSPRMCLSTEESWIQWSLHPCSTRIDLVTPSTLLAEITYKSVNLK